MIRGASSEAILFVKEVKKMVDRMEKKSRIRKRFVFLSCALRCHNPFKK
jgi:hypothetical protein